MYRNWRNAIITAATCIVVAVLLYTWFTITQQRIGVWQERERVARAEVARLQARGDSLANAFRRETVTVREKSARWRVLTDTLVLTDTVAVPVETVREIVRIADTTISACTNALGTCSRLVATRDSQIDALNARLKAEAKQRPGFFRRAGGKLAWLGAGIVVGAVVVR